MKIDMTVSLTEVLRVVLLCAPLLTLFLPEPSRQAQAISVPNYNDYEPQPENMPQIYHQGDNALLEGHDYHFERRHRWSYKNQNQWAKEYPLCKGKNLRQSPIDIRTNEVVFMNNIKLEFIDYDQRVTFQLKNTHHSVSLRPLVSMAKASVRLSSISGDTLFELDEIHFHWGDGKKRGSEHEINDKKAAAEMHMVHYRAGIDKRQIGLVDNSILVIAVLIESDPEDHDKLENLVTNTAYVNGTNMESVSDRSVNLINLLPDHHWSFYTYNGSLTTPPCYEVVTWVVMSEPVYMSDDKLVELSNLQASDPIRGRYKIAANNRNIQRLLDRPVYVSLNTSESNSETMRRLSFRKEMDSIEASVERVYHNIDVARKMALSVLGAH